ncbi:MAG: ribonuclease D [Streptosporangiaceae bacterium]
MIAQDVTLLADDVDQGFLDRAARSGRVAWDIETTGLDWRTARIGTVQVATADEIAVVQLKPGQVPRRLSQLLASTDVEKVFHHAPFDLRFVAWWWHVQTHRATCTKVLSKILDPAAPHDQHSLKQLLDRYLGVHITKDEQRSDWAAGILSAEQVAYAAADVRYLLRLLDVMAVRARAFGVWELACASFDYLPIRAALDLRGSGDVYAY